MFNLTVWHEHHYDVLISTSSCPALDIFCALVARV